jgi:hypothetical protein
MQSRFHDTYGEDELLVVAIDPDDDDYMEIARVEAFAKDIGVTFPVGVEETMNYEAFGNNFAGANPYPVDVIVDKKGIIRYVAREYDPSRMTEVIDELLAE